MLEKNFGCSKKDIAKKVLQKKFQKIFVEFFG